VKETQPTGPPIGRGTAVVIVLHTPREKCWGVLSEINQAGVFLRGPDLNAFDDWVSAVVHDEPFVGFSDLFFPMWRVERISKDEGAGGVPSLCEQVQRSTGHTIEELLQTDNQTGSWSFPRKSESIVPGRYGSRLTSEQRAERAAVAPFQEIPSHK
jgi:hypothetical protein